MKHIKHPKNDHPITESIGSRWSARAFNKQPITDDVLNSLFEAARWAASANNEQPWQYMYAHNGTEGFNKIFSCLAPGNQAWAGNAAILMVAAARKTFEATKAVNLWNAHDLGMANSNLIHQALSHDIYAHLMGGFDKTRLISELHLSEDTEPVCIIALGYLGNPNDLEEPFRTRELTERTRKPINEFTKAL